MTFSFGSFFCVKAKEKNINQNQLIYEKQGILEIRYSTGNIGFDGCTDSYQHNELHGTRSGIFLKREYF